MKAIVQDRYGPPDVLRLDDVDQPVPGDNQVLVRVHAASVNTADLLIMTGVPYVMRLGLGPRRPRGRVRGSDVAGTVTAVGGRVTGFRPGDAVYGEGDGTFAEYAVARADRLATKPTHLSFVQAAAVPMAATTALHAIRDHGRAGPGKRVLINGASGGIGTYAVQIAKHLGADVTGVCSTRNVDLVRSLGADHVIDYTRTDLTAEPTRDGSRYDVILDNVANHSLSDLRRLLTRDGTLLPNNGTTGGRLLGPLGRLARAAATSPFVSQRLRLFVSVVNQNDLATLSGLLAAGTLAPVIERTYPLEHVPEAVRHLAGRHAQGKLVVAQGA